MKKVIVMFLLMFSVSIFAQKIQNQTVEAACGLCQFKVKSDKDCHMSVKIDNKIYHVKGIDESVFGDAHAETGYCNVIRKAVVSGEVKKGKFNATSFKFAE